MLFFNKIKDINLTLLATDSHNQLKATLMNDSTAVFASKRNF